MFKLIAKIRLVLIMNIFVILLFSFYINPLLYTGGDNTHYIILGKSLAEGKGYTDLHLYDTPPHTVYPPVFPLILAGAIKIFGVNIVLLKVLVSIFAILSVNIMYFWFKKRTNENIVFLITLATISTLLFLQYSTRVMAEMPFLFFSLLSLNALTRLAESETLNIKAGISSGIWISLAILTRSIGIALIPAAFLYIFFYKLKEDSLKRNIKKILLIGTVVFFIVSPWVIRNSLVPSTQAAVPTYGEVLSEGHRSTPGLFEDFSGSVIRNVQGYIFSFVGFPRSLFISLLVFLGFGISFYTRKNVMEFYIFFYVLILLFWPWFSHRFVTPILPFLFYYFFVGCHTIGHLTASPFKKLKLKPLENLLINCGAIFLVIIVVINLHHNIFSKLAQKTPVEEYSESGAGWVEYYKAGIFLKHHVDPDSVAWCSKRRLMYMWTGLPMAYPALALTKDVTENLQSLYEQPIDLIVVDSFNWSIIPKVMRPLINKYPQYFKQVVEIGDTTIYRFQHKD